MLSWFKGPILPNLSPKLTKVYLQEALCVERKCFCMVALKEHRHSSLFALRFGPALASPLLLTIHYCDGICLAHRRPLCSDPVPPKPDSAPAYPCRGPTSALSIFTRPGVHIIPPSRQPRPATSRLHSIARRKLSCSFSTRSSHGPSCSSQQSRLLTSSMNSKKWPCLSHLLSPLLPLPRQKHRGHALAGWSPAEAGGSAPLPSHSGTPPCCPPSPIASLCFAREVAGDCLPERIRAVSTSPFPRCPLSALPPPQPQASASSKETSLRNSTPPRLRQWQLPSIVAPKRLLAG